MKTKLTLIIFIILICTLYLCDNVTKSNDSTENLSLICKIISPEDSDSLHIGDTLKISVELDGNSNEHVVSELYLNTIKINEADEIPHIFELQTDTLEPGKHKIKVIGKIENTIVSKDSIIINLLEKIVEIEKPIKILPNKYFETIQSAIKAAVNGDTIVISPGTYYENLDLLGKDIVITSEYYLSNDKSVIDSTIIDGQEKGSVMVFNKGEDCTVIIGITLQNGKYKKGAGVYCRNSHLILEHLIIKENNNDQSASIYCSEGYLNVNECDISNNINSGIYAINSTLKISNSVLSDNVGNGLIVREKCDVDITHSTFSNNSIGGCYLFYSTINKFRNNVLVDNGNYGIWTSSNYFEIQNCTVAYNDLGLSSHESYTKVSNSIFWNKNSEFDLRVTMSGGCTLDVTYSDFKGSLSSFEKYNQLFFTIDSTSISEYPRFCDPENGDYHLKPDSPCLNSGMNGGLIGALGVECE